MAFGHISGGYSSAFSSPDGLGYESFGQPGFYIGGSAKSDVSLDSNGASTGAVMDSALLFSFNTAGGGGTIYSRSRFNLVGLGTTIYPQYPVGATSIRFSFAQSYGIEQRGEQFVTAGTGSFGEIIPKNFRGNAARAGTIPLLGEISIQAGVFGATGTYDFNFDGPFQSGQGSVSQLLIWGVNSLRGETPGDPLRFQPGNVTSSPSTKKLTGNLGHFSAPVAGGYGRTSYVYAQGLGANGVPPNDTNSRAIEFTTSGANLAAFVVPELLNASMLYVTANNQRIGFSSGEQIDLTSIDPSGVDSFILELPDAKFSDFLKTAIGFRFIADGLNTVVATAVPIPEPSTLITACIGVTLLTTINRRGEAAALSSHP
ncbi:hypothetical protein [Lacipirellula limnantheis]|uniref:hypothetical protein n=1 Tax=Lacipirellula limnantheis TaxID=2528024 RepID=UPI0011A35613|nr:hypothetical protein [Lacipirellula limnantheis]